VITPRRTRLVRVPDLHAFRLAIGALAPRADAIVVDPGSAAAISAPARGPAPGSCRSQGLVIVRAGSSNDGAVRGGAAMAAALGLASTFSVIAAAVTEAGTRTQSMTRRYGL